MGIIQNVLDKILSARFIITVLVGLTYCKMVHHCVYFYLESMKADPGKMEAFATGLIMGFSGLAMLVIKSYFDIDRTVESKNGGSNAVASSDAKPNV